MPIWRDSKSETYYADGRFSLVEDCEVRIDGNVFIVNAQGEKGGWMWVGEEITTDHFDFKSTKTNGTGSLHRCLDGNMFEGSWTEDNVHGMWSVRLGLLQGMDESPTED